jgi:DNA-binding response OmpR family regulator
MYVLVLSDNILASKFISRGLKYENIDSKPMTLFDTWENYNNLHQFDALVCKIPSNVYPGAEIFEKFNHIQSGCSIFLITNNSKIHSEFFKISVSSHSYPSSINIRILAHEIKNVISKKYFSKEQKILRVSDLTLNLNTREAERFNRSYYLRNKEFYLLEFLMENTDIIFNRQQILEHVWDRNANLFTNTVDVHINILRKKLDYKPGFHLIETVYCSGYIMHSKPYD